MNTIPIHGCRRTPRIHDSCGRIRVAGARSAKARYSCAGFTIIETLVSVSILLLIIVAPLTLAERSLASADAAGVQVTAVYLAQEAIEFVRNVRDTNMLMGSSWLNRLDDCLNGAQCDVDPTNPEEAEQIISCTPGGNDNCRLWQYQGNVLCLALKGLFGHKENRSECGGEWVRSPFSRTVMITTTNVSGTEEVRVEVLVKWETGRSAARSSLIVSTNLMPWYAAN